MTSSSRHPSFLALDRFAVANHGDPAVREHTERCATCSQHVQSIRTGRDTPPAAIARRRLTARVWAGIAAAALVAISGATLVIGSGSRDAAVDERYTTVKGHPTVALYVKRGERVFSWMAGQDIVPGDRLRLEIAPEGFSHVTVLAKASGREPSDRLEQLYAAAIDPRKPALLPAAWRVDEVPGAETLVVVLSREPLGEEALARALQEENRNDDLWVERLVLPKQTQGLRP